MITKTILYVINPATIAICKRVKTRSIQTLKAQGVVNKETGQIICTAFGKGTVHDFRLFKLERLPMLPEQLWLADKGDRGLGFTSPS